MDVLVEINIGQNRCGVSNADEVSKLLDVIAAHPQLTFRGLQAYHGGVQHIRSHSSRRDAVMRATDRTAEVVHDLLHSGVPCPVVTGGGSGSVEFDLGSGVYTEVQPGSYVFMDGDYSQNITSNELHFEHSLFVTTSVMSTSVDTRVIVDAGLKSIATDSGLPIVWIDGAPSMALHYAAANDEHGIIRVHSDDAAGHPTLGDRMLLVPGHCDPTLNLHDEIIGFRDGRVEVIWQVEARGCSR